MSDINEIKARISTLKGFMSLTIQDVDSLITTIESQKEKIIDLESQKALLDEVLPHLEVSGNIILKQQKEISSLKAITELAVKGLKDIKLMLDMDHSDYQKYQIWKAAADPLDEIERLTNGTT